MLLLVVVVRLLLMIDDIAILLHLDYELLVVHDDENTHDLEVAHAVVTVDNIDQKKVSNHEDNLDDVPSYIEEVLRDDAVVDILVDNDDFVESPTEVLIDTCHAVGKEVVHERADTDLVDHIDDDVLQDIHNVDLDDDNSYEEEVHH